MFVYFYTTSVINYTLSLTIFLMPKLPYVSKVEIKFNFQNISYAHPPLSTLQQQVISNTFYNVHILPAKNNS